MIQDGLFALQLLPDNASAGSFMISFYSFLYQLLGSSKANFEPLTTEQLYSMWIALLFSKLS